MGGQKRQKNKRTSRKRFHYEVCLQGIMAVIFIILDCRDICFDECNCQILLLVMPSSFAMQA